jgi:hypothetical protein
VLDAYPSVIDHYLQTHEQFGPEEHELSETEYPPEGSHSSGISSFPVPTVELISRSPLQPISE